MLKKQQVNKKYAIDLGASIREALIKINNNKKGFLLVLKDGKIIGTLTDGDLRRAFISGKNIDDGIEDSVKYDFKYVKEENFFENTVELFKSDAVEFLPILDEKNELVNVITKKQMHCLLLRGENISYDYDFDSVDETIMDYEIFQRPWGFYKTTVLNDFFQSKIISINPMASLSLQMHNKREEHWVVVHGIGEARIGESIKKIQSGDYVFVPKGCRHRLRNLSETEILLLTEVQIGNYFGEDDIIRFEDDYGRI